MAWVRIDDQFAQHPKVKRAGPLAIALQIAGLCYCGQYLTDGRVPRDVVPSLLNLEGLGMRLWEGELSGGGEDATWELIVEDLTRAGMWKERKDGGYYIHDYLKYNPSRREVLADRRRRQQIIDDRIEAGRKGGIASGEARGKQTPKQKASKAEHPVPVPLSTTSPPDQQVDPTEKVSPLTAAACQDTFFEGTNPVAALVDMAVKVEGVDRAHVDGGGLGGVIKRYGRGKDVWEALRAYTLHKAVGPLHMYMMKVLANGQKQRGRATYGQAGGGYRKGEGRASEGIEPLPILTEAEVKRFSAERRAEEQGVQGAGAGRGDGAGQAVPGDVPGPEVPGDPAEQPGDDG